MCFNIPSKSPLEKTIFASAKQLSIGDSILIRDGRLCPHAPFSASTNFLLNLCRSCACRQSFMVNMCISPIVRGNTSPLCLAIFLPPSLRNSPSPEGMDSIKIPPLELSVQKPLTLCSWSSCESQYAFPSNSEGSFFDDGWVRCLSVMLAALC